MFTTKPSSHTDNGIQDTRPGFHSKNEFKRNELGVNVLVVR